MIRFISTVILLGLYLSPAAQSLSAIYGGGVRTEISPISCTLLPNCDDQDPLSEDFCLDGFCAHTYVDGFPNATTFHMNRFDNGELVFGTQHSLVRHSAGQTSILKSSDPRIPKNWYFRRRSAPAMDANGALWIDAWVYTGSAADYALLRWSGNQIDTFRAQIPTPYSNPVDLEIGPNGTVYLLTYDEYLISFDGQNWQSTDLNSYPTLANSTLRLRQLQFDANDDLWLSGYNQQSKAALAHFDGSNWTIYQSVITVFGNATEFLITANGDKWVGARNTSVALARFNGTWTEYNAFTLGNLPSGTTPFPKEGPNNTLWLPSGTNGITQMDITTGTFTQFGSQNSGYPFSQAGLIAVNPNSNEVYFNNPEVGENQIGQYDGINWNVISPAEGPGEEFNRSFLDLEADGNIWYRGQLSEINCWFDGVQWQNLPFNEEILVLEVDANGGYWFITGDPFITSTLQYYDGNTITNVPLPSVPNPFFDQMAIDANGDLWLLGYQEPWRYDGSSWTQHSAGAVGCPVRRLASDANGDIFVSCENGSIYQWSGSNWTNFYTSSSNLYSQRLLPIPNQANSFWLTGSASGTREARLIRPSGTILYNSNNAPLNDFNLYRAAIDSNGHAWGLSESDQRFIRLDDQGFQTYDADSMGVRLDTTSHIAFDAEGNLWVSNISTVYQFGSQTVPMDTVWPGDANDDLIANYLDFLDLGIAFGSSGPIRANATTNWQAEPVISWSNTLPNGANYAHTDTDGSGTANFDDTLAIILNYGLTHNKSSGTAQSGSTPLLIFPDSSTYQAGDTVFAPIILGLDTLIADSVYGLGFTISYDPILVDSGSVQIDFSNSWLGMKNQDMISFARDDYANGQVDIALTRNDQTERSGFGEIARMRVVMIDDISGKDLLRDTLRFEISGVRLIRKDDTPIPYDTEIAGVEITQEQEATNLAPDFQTQWLVYPNPAQNELIVEAQRSAKRQSHIRIYNLQGQLVLEERIKHNQVRLDLTALPNALYLLQIEDEIGVYRQKIQIRH